MKEEANNGKEVVMVWHAVHSELQMKCNFFLKANNSNLLLDT